MRNIFGSLSIMAATVVGIAAAMAADTPTATVVWRSSGCRWFAVKDPVLETCSIVQQLRGNVPFVGERVRVEGNGLKDARIHDSSLICADAIEKLRQRCE